MEEQWMESLRRRFADRQTSVPDNLWDDISAAMGEQRLPSAKPSVPKKKARRISLWWSRAAAVAACAAVVVGIWYFRDAETAYKTGVADRTAMSQSQLPESQDESVVAMDKTAEEDGNGLHDSMIRALKTVAANVAPGIMEEVTEQTVENGQADKVAETAGTSVPTERIADKNDKNKSQDIYERKNKLPKADNTLFAYAPEKRRERGVSLGFYGAAPSSIGSGSGGGFPTVRSSYVQADAGIGDKNIHTPMRSHALTYGTDEHYAVKSKHHQPVRFGASVRLPLNDRWGLETGLNYSYLSSDFTFGDERGGYDVRQRLHYVGVPLNVSCNLWRVGRFAVYASAGGAVDFCVSGRSETDTHAAGTTSPASSERMRETRPQLSVSATAGVEYKFTDALGVYVEPGVAYYFDNGSDVTTVYKDKPLNLNINLGLRIELDKKR